jgi:hypothetical protein
MRCGSNSTLEGIKGGRSLGGFEAFLREADAIACAASVFISRSSAAFDNRGSRRNSSMYRKLALSLVATVALIFQLAVAASATLGVGGFAVRESLSGSSPVEHAQFVWGGRNYCWYNSAWRGAGWYWCGYAWRRGIGWGGGAGWRGWRHPTVVVHHRPVHRTHVVHHNNRPVHRPGHNNRPNHNRPAHNRPGHNRPNHNRPNNNRPGHNRPSGGNRGGGHNRSGGHNRGGGGGQRRR